MERKKDKGRKKGGKRRESKYFIMHKTKRSINTAE